MVIDWQLILIALVNIEVSVDQDLTVVHVKRGDLAILGGPALSAHHLG